MTQTENHGDYGVYTLTEVLPDADGRIPACTRLSLDKQYVKVGMDLGFHLAGEAHRTRLRLYRPGYQLVEIESWDSADRAQWRLAKVWSDQEKAIDGLLDGPRHQYDGTDILWNPEGKTFQHLPIITDDSANAMRPFQFAAAEYERVAVLAPTPADAARLRDKAKRLVEIKAAEKRLTPESP